jgi:hypothetical protein
LERQWAEVYDQAVRTTHGARDSRERTRQIIAKMRAIGDFSDSPHNRSSSVLRANRQQVIQLHNQVNSFLPEASRVGFAEHASLDFAYAERMISRLKDLTVHYQMVDRITMVEFADVRVGRKADAGAWVTPLGGGRSKVTVNMSEELRNLQLSVFTDGWFHAPQGTDLAEYFMTHEFGHVLDNATGFTAKNDATVKAIVRRLTSPPPGLLKTEDVVELAYAKGLISGYALFGYQEYKVFTELLAESFAAVLYNGAAASPVERTIYDRLMSALYR